MSVPSQPNTPSSSTTCTPTSSSIRKSTLWSIGESNNNTQTQGPEPGVSIVNATVQLRRKAHSLLAGFSQRFSLQDKHRSTPNIEIDALPEMPSQDKPYDDAIVGMVQKAITCPLNKEIVLSFRGEAAGDTVRIIQQMLDNAEIYDVEPHRYTLRRLLISLSRSSEALPPSLFLKGVQCRDRNPWFSGGFADIYRATYKTEVVALKKLRTTMGGLPMRRERRNNQNYDLAKEALVWRQLKHPYILPFLGIDGDSFKPSLCLISPYMQNGNILRCMERLDELRADIPREPWLLEIARGLAYLHSENVVHADLRGVNILVDDDLHIRLSDFGLALVIDPSSTSYTCSYLGGSARWLAPEVLKETQPSFQSDIYAFGCVCVEIYTRLPPFPDLKDTQVVAQVIRGARPTRPRTGMQAYVWNVVRKCWKWDPQSRPNAEGIVDALCHGDTLASFQPQRMPPPPLPLPIGISPKKSQPHLHPSRSRSPLGKTKLEYNRFELVDGGNLSDTQSVALSISPPTAASYGSFQLLSHHSSRNQSPSSNSGVLFSSPSTNSFSPGGSSTHRRRRQLKSSDSPNGSLRFRSDSDSPQHNAAAFSDASSFDMVSPPISPKVSFDTNKPLPSPIPAL